MATFIGVNWTFNVTWLLCVIAMEWRISASSME